MNTKKSGLRDSGMKLLRHEQTFLTLQDTAVERRFDMQYLKTYDFPGEFINSFHGSLAESIGPSGMIDIGVEA